MDFSLLDLLDEQACYDFLVDALHPDGLACTACGGGHLTIHRAHRDIIAYVDASPDSLSSCCAADNTKERESGGWYAAAWGRWPSEKHFTSCLGLCPKVRLSGGKVQSCRMRRRRTSSWH